jgi:hypothetical protein
MPSRPCILTGRSTVAAVAQRESGHMEGTPGRVNPPLIGHVPLVKLCWDDCMKGSGIKAIRAPVLDPAARL